VFDSGELNHTAGRSPNPGHTVYIYFGGDEAAMEGGGPGGAQRPALLVNEHQKTDALRARARSLAKNHWSAMFTK
jgi:hypothetical protein